jgi:hypothetical protein
LLWLPLLATPTEVVAASAAPMLPEGSSSRRLHSNAEAPVQVE